MSIYKPNEFEYLDLICYNCGFIHRIYFPKIEHTKTKRINTGILYSFPNIRDKTIGKDIFFRDNNFPNEMVCYECEKKEFIIKYHNGGK